MNSLQIRLTGEVTDTNFEEWKTELLRQITSSNRELKTDDDFAIAEDDVKKIKAGEKALKTAKQSALEQAAAIQKLFSAIDEVTEEARQARLSLERQIKQRKAEIKDEIVNDGLELIDSYVASQDDEFQSLNHRAFMDRDTLEEYTKGKRSSDSMRKAINSVVTSVKEEVDAKVVLIKENRHHLNKVDSAFTSLFQDESTLLVLPSGELESTISDRIEFYQQQQAKLAAEIITEPETSESTGNTTETETTEESSPPLQTAKSAAAVPGQFTISLEIFADESRANEFLDELEGRYGHRDMIGEIKLSQ